MLAATKVSARIVPFLGQTIGENHQTNTKRQKGAGAKGIGLDSRRPGEPEDQKTTGRASPDRGPLQSLFKYESTGCPRNAECDKKPEARLLTCQSQRRERKSCLRRHEVEAALRHKGNGRQRGEQTCSCSQVRRASQRAYGSHG